jgi:hypothetical protein
VKPSRRQRREAARLARKSAPAPVKPAIQDVTPPVPWATFWLVVAFLLPNLRTVAGSFLYDDLPLIVQNARLHSLARLGEVWTHGYWPDRPGLTLYRPVTQTIWSLIWAVGGGRPWPFHVLNLMLGSIVVVLVYRLLSDLHFGSRVAFLASLLFAILPIHTEVIAAIVGSNELLAAGFGLGALILYRRGSLVAALLLFILGVFSKESAATVAGLAVILPFLESRPRPPLRRLAAHAGVAGLVVVLALWARTAVADGPVFIPPIDNPMSLVHGPERLFTALWVQVLYVWRSIVPITLSADYSYREIPLVMTLADPRAWCGLALVALTYWSFARRPATRAGIALWVVAFLPAANLLMPIGTTMGERLAYLPSVGLVLLLAQGMTRIPKAAVAAAFVIAVFAVRTFEQNQVWHDADAFYPKLVETSPDSAKAHYFLGCWKAAHDDNAGALESYDRAIQIFPAYPEALNNRANALVRLGRLEEAKASFRECLRFDPNHAGAADSLRALEAGITFVPQRPKI